MQAHSDGDSDYAGSDDENPEKAIALALGVRQERLPDQAHLVEALHSVRCLLLGFVSLRSQGGDERLAESSRPRER